MAFFRFENLVLAVLIVSASACKMTGIDQPNHERVEINPELPSLVILGRRHISHNATEHDYIGCLADSLEDENWPLNIIPEQQFIDDMYPFFEQSTAPLNISNFKAMVQEPAVTQKLQELNLKYLIWIDGKTETVDQSGGVSCAIGPGGGGCLGFASWEDEADYGASIWDINSLSVSNSVYTTRSGTSYMPAIIVPIPLLANVQENACEEMAGRIKRSI